VTIDGGTAEIVDLYNISTVYNQTIYEKTELDNGLHHMSIKVLGRHSAGSDNWVNIDCVVVEGIEETKSRIEENNIAIEYTGLWSTYENSGYSEGKSYSTTRTGASVSYTFYGTGIEWISSPGNDRGIAKVTLDNEPYTLIDLYNASLIGQEAVYKRYNLPLGQHTIKIETTGNKSATSSGYHVPVDGFNVVGAVTTAPQTPTGLSAVPGNGKITLNWNSSGEDAIAYRIYRYRGPVEDGIISLKLVRGTTYTDDNVIPGVEYSYRVTAIGALGMESGMSEAVTAVPYVAGTGISVPEGVTALLPNSEANPRYEEDQAGITYSSEWERITDNNANGRYYRRTNKEGATATINFSGTGIKWIAPRLTNGSTAEVWLDGKLDAIVNLYSSNNEYNQTVYQRTQLADGYHMLEIRCVGWNYIYIDSIIITGSDDNTPPETVTGISITRDNTKLEISWDASTDSELDGYKVYRSTLPDSGFKLLGSSAMQMVRGTTRYTDTGLKNGVTYYYIVTAVDQNGNESVLPVAVSEIPAALAGIHEENDIGMVYSDGWSRQVDNRASGSYYQQTTKAGSEASLTFYGTGIKIYSVGVTNGGIAEVYIDGVLKGSFDLYRSSNQYNIMVWQNEGPLDLGVHEVVIRNTNNKNPNSSGTRLIVDYIEVITSTDVTPPEVPSNLTAMRDGDSGIAYLQWTWGKDEDLYGYNIYRSTNGQEGTFVKINPDPIKFASMYIDTTAPETAYYKVAAVDTSGNVSDMSVTAILSDASGDYSIVEENNEIIKYTGVWNRSADSKASGGYLQSTTDSNVKITYTFYGTGIDWLATTTPTSRTVMVSIDGGQPVRVDLYSPSIKYEVPVFRVRNIPLGMHTIEIIDSERNSASSNNYIYSDAFRIVDADTTPPSAPTDLKAEALVNKVMISWTDSPEPDVVGYNIYYRYGVFEYQKVNLAGPVQSVFWHTGLNLNTMYYYIVKAVDSLGNESDATAEVSARTADSLIKAVLEPTYNAIQGQSVTFDASNSYSADPPITYEWDLDNDDEYDDGTGVIVTYIFEEVGTYTISLRVKDSMGRTDTTSATVIVREPDVTPPLLVSSEPANGSTSVPVDSSIKFTFNENIQQGSAFVNITMKDGKNTAVAFTAVIADNVLIITPLQLLENNNSYNIYLPVRAVKDMSGNESVQDYYLSFGTPDTIPPAVIGATVAKVPGKELINEVKITFSESILAGNNYGGIIVKDEYNRNIAYTASISANVLTITTVDKLEYDTSYKVILLVNSVKDKSGNHYADEYEFNFTTEAAVHELDMPYGYWKFDNEILTDFGTGGHNGIVHGNPQVIDGVKDGAYSFDGTDDYVELGNWFNLEKFSISMWVYVSDEQNTDNAIILDNNHDTNENWSIQNNKNVSITKYSFYDAEVDIDTNRWQHVVWVKDSNNSKIYIDGVLVYNASSTPINYTGNQNLIVAGWAKNEGRNWKGSIDELRIYNYLLAQSEVRTLYLDSRPDSGPPVIISVTPANEAAIGGPGTEKLTVYFTEDGSISDTSAKAEYSLDGVNWNLIGNGIGPTDEGNGVYSYYFNLNKTVLNTGTYQVKYTVTDKMGNNAEQVVVYHVDRTAPTAVRDLDAVYNEGRVVVSWTISIEADVTSYKVYRATETEDNFVEIGTVNGRNNTTYSDNTVVLGNTYRYKVAAVDRYGQVGEPAGPVSVQLTEDTVSPTILGIEPVDNSVIGAVTQITVRARDDYKLESIKLQYSIDGNSWVDVETINTTANAVFTLIAPINDGSLLVRAIAIDAAGNESDGMPVRRYIIDTTGPEKVTGVELIPSTTSIMIKWNDVDDAAYFKVDMKDSADGIYQNIGTVTDKLYLNVTGLMPNKEYWFRVTAYDALNNMGIPSDEVSCFTTLDSVAPSITAIHPAPGRYSRSIQISVSATDNVGIAKLTLQYSIDAGGDWHDMHVAYPAGMPKNTTINYTWDVSEIAEGLVYVRAIAEDASGNVSSGTSYVEYMIDRTGPSAPTGVKAVATSSKVTITWDKNDETDLHYYRVYRSTEGADSGYSLISGSVSSLGYVDTDVLQEVTYYYKVAVVDTAGNEGEASIAVSIVLQPDETAPVIYSISPGSGSTLNDNSTIRVLVGDDYKLKKVYMEYRKAGDDSIPWTLLDTYDNLNIKDSVFTFAVSKGTFEDAEYVFRVIAEDQYNHISNPLSASYHINTEPPQAPVLTAEPGGWKVNLSWTSGEESDLAGYYIYRSTTSGGPYIRISQAPKGYNSYVDEGNNRQGLNPAFTYYYVVEAVDIYGNISRSTEISAQPLNIDTYLPIANAGDDIHTIVGIETSFDGTASRDNDAISSYEWDFGDGSEKAYSAQPVHIYNEAGRYTVTLTVTDRSGNRASDTLVVTVNEVQKVGTLEVIVIDADTGSPIPYASVAIQYPDSEPLNFKANSSGVAFTAAEPGDFKVYAYATGYMPVSADATVEANRKKQVTIKLRKGELVVGELTVRRMTIDEIEAAGIDTTDPENQWVYRYEVHLAFNEKPIPTEPIISNGNGKIFNPKPIVITLPSDPGSGTSKPSTVVAYPTVIPHPNHPEIRPTIAYMVIPGEARWLKEFFEVGLTLENTADPEFVLADSSVTLVLPKNGGLVLAPTRDPQSLTIDLGSIAGGESRQVKWIIRGDKKGYYGGDQTTDYGLTAIFEGILLPFKDKVQKEFVSEAGKIHVWGDDAIRLHIDAQDEANKGYPYHVRFGIENKADVPVYNAAIELKDDTKQNYIYAPNQELKKW